jgi:hypothetical protein
MCSEEGRLCAKAVVGRSRKNTRKSKQPSELRVQEKRPIR